MIQDSGSRTEFDTGAVRDMSEGKRRIHLDILSVMFRRPFHETL